MGIFDNIIWTLDNMGITDVILPFMIVFVVVFAALQKSLVLGKDSKKYNVIVALVLGLSVVIPHVTGMYPPNGDIVEIMNRALPNVSLIAIAFVMIMLLLGIIGGEVDFAGKSLGGWAVLVSIVAVIVIFIGSAGFFSSMPWWLQWINNAYTMEIIVSILVFGIIIWFITKEDKPAGKDKEGKFFEGLSDIWKKGK